MFICKQLSPFKRFPQNNICIVHVVVPKLIIILFHLYPFNKKASPLPSIRDPTYVKNFSKRYKKKKKYRQQVDNSFTRITTTIVFFFEFSVSWNVKSQKKKKKRMKSKGGKKNIRKFLANQFHDTRIYTRAPEILKNISEETKAQRGGRLGGKSKRSRLVDRRNNPVYRVIPREIGNAIRVNSPAARSPGAQRRWIRYISFQSGP